MKKVVALLEREREVQAFIQLLQNCKGKQIVPDSLFISRSCDVVCDFPQQAYFPN